MITQVSGPNSDVVVKDPRRKAQRVQFKHSAQIPYQSSYSKYERQQKNALWTSIYIVLGSVIFTAGYLLLSGIRNSPK